MNSFCQFYSKGHEAHTYLPVVESAAEPGGWYAIDPSPSPVDADAPAATDEPPPESNCAALIAKN